MWVASGRIDFNSFIHMGEGALQLAVLPVKVCNGQVKRDEFRIDVEAPLNYLHCPGWTTCAVVGDAEGVHQVAGQDDTLFCAARLFRMIGLQSLKDYKRLIRSSRGGKRLSELITGVTTNVIVSFIASLIRPG